MPRPKRGRRVCCLPEQNRFGPLNCAAAYDEDIILLVEEYEAIRLIDLEGLTQEECADNMNVARTTVQNMYGNARKKIADALVNGKEIHIAGGSYELCAGISRCGKRKGCCRKRYHRPSTEEKEFRMKVAVPLEEKNKEAVVCPSFGRAPYFLIYDIPTQSEEFIDNTAAESMGGAGPKAAQIIADKGVGAVITPRCGENAAEVLQMAHIELYRSEEGSAYDNLIRLEKGTLEKLNDIHPGFHA